MTRKRSTNSSKPTRRAASPTRGRRAASPKKPRTQQTLAAGSQWLVSGLRLSLDESVALEREGLLQDSSLLRALVAAQLGLAPQTIASAQLRRRSVDARHKQDVHFTATVAITLAEDGAATIPSALRLTPYKAPEPLEIPDCGGLQATLSIPRPLVVGAGPAGLFCAWVLAQAGLKPLLIEQGAAVDERRAAVEAFEQGAELDLYSNVQFGEGGAGTFSDGKLNTGIKSPHIRQVLQLLVEAGAPEEILVDAKPHIGTDRLGDAVKAIRQQIEEAGGKVAFHHHLDRLVFSPRGSVCEAVITDLVHGQSWARKTSSVVLACGHSARDTFSMLQDLGVPLSRKPFAVGVRIEHTQDAINRMQYGSAAGHEALGAADYKVAVHTQDGRGVYSFCMCPGGSVVAAASEEGRLCVNGMSNYRRDGENANSALLVEVRPEDIPGEDPLAAVAFQRELEQRAYERGAQEGQPWNAPAERVGDFLYGRTPQPSVTVAPSYPRGVVWTDLRSLFPSWIGDALAEALPVIDKKMPGFCDEEAVLTAPEARSSSPVRMDRDPESLQSVYSASSGLYPCGEGAGYAGGIMSAAVDGIRVAHAVIAALQEQAADSLPSSQGEGAEGSSSSDGSDAAIALAVPTQNGAPETESEERVPLTTEAQAAQRLTAGQPLIAATDTVYGLGVAVEYCPSPQVLYDLKGRPDAKPIAWLVPGVQALETYGMAIPGGAYALAKQFWPGALTLVVNATDRVPEAYRSSEGTIGLRCPNAPQLIQLMEEVSSPLAMTSANPSGCPAPSLAAAVDEGLAEAVGGVLMGTDPVGGVASTVVDCTHGIPQVVREGAIDESAILAVWGQTYASEWS